MTKNNRLQRLQQLIGKTFPDSPSPFMFWLNPVVVSAEEGNLTFKYVIRKEWTNPMGILHGGVTGAIIDDIIGATIFCYGEDNFYSTINNVIDYFSAAKENETVLAETKIIKKGRQLINAQCEVWNADKSRLIARGYSNLLKTEITKMSS